MEVRSATFVDCRGRLLVVYRAEGGYKGGGRILKDLFLTSSLNIRASEGSEY